MYAIAIGVVLALHLLFLAWVIGGAFVTRGRPWLTAAHLFSLTWGVVVEIGPWPCPLTVLEQNLTTAAGKASYQGSFLLHYLQLLVYPNISAAWLIAGGLVVCSANFVVYGYRWWRWQYASARSEQA